MLIRTTAAFFARLPVLALLLLCLSAMPLGAQALDPAMLQQLKQHSSGPQAAPSPVDAARQGGAPGAWNGPALQNPETPAERLLRDQQARRSLRGGYEATAIEQAYRVRVQDHDLRQFGYDLFSSDAPSDAPMTGRVSDDYVLGVGDEVVLIFQGGTARNVTTRVDREGRLIVEPLRPIHAAGRTLAQVRRDLEAITRQTLLGTEVFLSVGGVRAVSVFIGGEVAQPGRYSFSSMTDVVTALAKAGGVRRSGSLRRIFVQNGSARRTVDLYSVMGYGSASPVTVRDGDRIIVPPVGPTIAVTGAVARPGIFELPAQSQSISVQGALDLAGGLLRPNGVDMVVGRIGKEGREQFSVASRLDNTLTAADVLVATVREGSAAGRVFLLGHVDAPGVRALGSAPSVRALLGAPGRLRAGVYMPMAVLLRRDLQTQTTVKLPISLLSALGRGLDVPLASDDQLILFGPKDLSFLQSVDVRRILLGQPNRHPGCRSLEALESLIGDTQADRFGGMVRGSFLVSKAMGTDVAAGAGAMTTLGVPDVGRDLRSASAGGAVNVDGSVPSAATSGGTPTDGAFCPDVFERDPSLLPFLMEHAVSIGGAVRRPGGYPVAHSLSVQQLAAVADGIVARPDILDLTITPGAEAGAGSDLRAVPVAALADVLVRPGDDVRLSTPQARLEAGSVLLTGEVSRPGLYTIRKGETLSQLLERAGGLTEYAYPYGAVFTRRSVKRAQEEALRRTARELNAALISVTARKGATGDSLSAAAALAQSLATADVPGRMVVEADPLQLARKTALDTVLEAGDALFLPKKPNYVLAVGDVLNPGALQYTPDKKVRDYLDEAGGVQVSADQGRAFLVLPNGVAHRISRNFWGRRTQQAVPPGSTVVVPKDVDPLFVFDIIKDVSSIVGQLATTLASIAILSR